MGFRCGLVGLPNAGKSTVFNALLGSGASARAEPYPFCTLEANMAWVDVPDAKLDRLAALFPEKKRVPTQLQLSEGNTFSLLCDAKHNEVISHAVGKRGCDSPRGSLFRR